MYVVQRHFTTGTATGRHIYWPHDLWAPLAMLAVEAAEAMAHRDEGTTPEERPRQMPKEADCVSPKW